MATAIPNAENMTNLDFINPLTEFSIKLCAAVKKYKCLHDQNSYRKSARPECEEAWEVVAEECNETVENCKNRWKSLRRCFFKGLKRRGSKYYLHDHLQFLEEYNKKTPKRKAIAACNEETYSTGSYSLKNSQEEEDSEMKGVIMYDDDEVKSNDSRTTSADESNHLVKQSNQSGVFIINELEEEAFEDFPEERRLSYRRSCKRPLNPELIGELTEEEPEEKRYRQIDSHSTTAQTPIKPIRVRMDKIKLNIIEKNVVSTKDKMVHGFTQTDIKQTKDFGTQYESNSIDFDDVFINSIKTQLIEMNARQKLIFKRKIYESLVEVFDDGNDFPNDNDTLPLTPKQLPTVVDTTIGELRLMRELVALVQAAKITPEIMNAKDKPIISSTTPLKMPLPIVNNSAKSQISPKSLCPSPEDEDLQYFIDNLDDEGEVLLPKPAEPTRTTRDENVAGLPRRVLQKVVRVSGPSGSTIVTRDGDKKRIYRIFPKVINPNGNNAAAFAKNGNSSGSFLVSTSKNLISDAKKDGSVGTFYVSATKNPQDSTKLSNGGANINIRSLNNKSTNPDSNSAKTGIQPIMSNGIIESYVNNPTIFKGIHPANRVLSPTTGYFKMMPVTKSITPSATVPSTAVTTNTHSSKTFTAKLPASSMLPPNNNAVTKRVQAMRAGPQIMQRRYSICGPLPGDKLSSTSANGNSPVKSNISQIQISQPISLNAKAINAQTTSTSSQSFSSNIHSKTTATPAACAKNDKLSIQSQKRAEESIDNSSSVTTTLKKSNHIPILKTAGTIEADDLDPLFVNPPAIKSEPVDD